LVVEQGYYCNEKCLVACTTKYHKYECGCGPYFHMLMLPRNFLLALRILTTLQPAGIKTFFQNGTTPEEEMLKSSSGELILGSEGGVYRSQSYLPIHHLISHPQKCLPSELLSYAVTAITITHILQKHSSFFEGLEDSTYAEFVSSLLLLHFQNLPCNAHSLYSLPNGPCESSEEESREWIGSAVGEEYGVGAFGVLSLINHSCDPNTVRSDSNSTPPFKKLKLWRGIQPTKRLIQFI
jgi:hypothetical protein